MREIEFLPTWYPQLHKRKRLVMVQSWTTIVLLGGLCLWSWLSGRNIQTASASLKMLERQLNETDNELVQLGVQVTQQKQLKQKDQVMARLGGHVEATRVLNAIEASMPAEMSVISLSTELEERQRPGSTMAAERAAQGSGPPPVDRRIRIRVTGIGPTDGTVATFMANLYSSGLFDRPEMSYARERLESSRSMREFEVAFSVDLNQVASRGGP